MITLNPVLTGDTPNPNVSYNNAWIPVGNEGNRPFFAQATYDVTTESTLGQSGFVFLSGGQNTSGEFSTIQVVSACRFTSISANNSTIGALCNFEYSSGFSINGPITYVALQYGAVIVYKL